MAESCLAFGPFRFVPGDGLWRGEVEVPLPPRALAVLAALVAWPGQLVTKAELLDAGWKDAFVTEASLLEAIHVLRVALGDDRRAPAFIQTVHRRGYRFVAPVTHQGVDAPGQAHEKARPVPPHNTTSPDEVVADEPPTREFPPFFSGPEWHVIVRRCAWAGVATALTSLLVAAFGPRPHPMHPRHHALVLPASLREPMSGGAMSASPDGRRVAFVALDEGRPAVFVREVSGLSTIKLADAGSPGDPFFSPDGRVLGYFADGQVKVAAPGQASEALAHAVPGAGVAFDERLTVGPAEVRAPEPVVAAGSGLTLVSPAWRADGLEVAFAANKAGPYNLFVRPLVGGPDVPLDASPWNQVPSSWSPDGRFLAFTEFHPATGADVWVVDRVTRQKRPLARTPLDETGARYSPDGRWLAYLSRTSGEWHVLVVPSGGGSAQARFPAHRLRPRRADERGRELRIVVSWFAELAERMRGPA